MNDSWLESFRNRAWSVAVKQLAFWPLVLLVGLFNFAGLRGVNFGNHWDELEFQIEPVRQMLHSGIFLPQGYIYPSLAKWLSLLPAALKGFQVALDSNGSPAAVQASMLAAMSDTQGYLLSVRAIYIAVSSLALVWVYGAALALRQRWWEALIAAASLGVSWEYSYHSRFVATDCILVQFAALVVFTLAMFRRTKRPGWLCGAAVAVGLATGTKYPGVFLLFPVLLAGALSLPLLQLRAQVWRAVLVCGLAFLSYLVSTPATLLDPFRFITETRWVSNYYMHTHGGYTATSALDHLRIALSYFALAYFSPYVWPALALFAFVLVGAVLWLRQDWRFSAVVVGFPLMFLAFFCIRYRVVMVRNYLFLVPFLSLLLSRGLGGAFRSLPQRWLKLVAAGVLLVTFQAQAMFIVAAGESIRHIDPSAYATEALRYVAAHPQVEFRVSPQIQTLAKAQQLPLPHNVSDTGNQVVFFGRSEGPDSWHWMTNDPFLTEATFGPREVNFNWYSSWGGNDRVVVMTLDKAARTGVPLAN